MRLAPLAVVLQAESDLTTRLQVTADYTKLTHRHPRAILGSELYLECLHAMLNGASLAAALAQVSASLQLALRHTPDVLAEWSHTLRAVSNADDWHVVRRSD